MVANKFVPHLYFTVDICKNCENEVGLWLLSLVILNAVSSNNPFGLTVNCFLNHSGGLIDM